jgi:hypothetical protein
VLAGCGRELVLRFVAGSHVEVGARSPTGPRWFGTS